MVSAPSRLANRSLAALTAPRWRGYPPARMRRGPAPTDASDEALVAALAGGDERAMAALYARHAPLL